MKRQLLNISMFFFGISALMLSSCKKESEGEGNDEEVITTMQLTFVPQGGGTTLTYKFDDPDGPGGTPPTQQQIVLATNKTYNVSVQLLNKTKNPVEDITMEVADEPEAHRFYYEPSTGSNITVSGLDTDPAGLPLGINSVWTTTTAATGTLKVTLRHYAGNPPNKAASDPVNSPKSSTDIEVNFSTAVQ